MSIDETLQTNLAWWNERAAFHPDTSLYRRSLAALASGGHALLPVVASELAQIGLAGKRVAHVQCHIGTDTVSLMRLGADAVVGFDFSNEALRQAAKLASTLGIAASFVEAKVGDMSATCEHRRIAPFDMVFTSEGVLSWMPDLGVWANDLAGLLAYGGVLYLHEQHPVSMCVDDGTSSSLRLKYPYSTHGEALVFDEPGTYADAGHQDTVHNRTHDHAWGLGEVINALVQAGFVVTSLLEHDVGFYPSHPMMALGEDGHWRLPAPYHGQIPLTYSLVAQRIQLR